MHIRFCLPRKRKEMPRRLTAAAFAFLTLLKRQFRSDGPLRFSLTLSLSKDEGKGDLERDPKIDQLQLKPITVTSRRPANPWHRSARPDAPALPR